MCMIKQNEILHKRPNAKTQLIRVPDDMYREIQRIADEQRRSITLQAQILLGAAINRDLVSPKDIEA